MAPIQGWSVNEEVERTKKGTNMLNPFRVGLNYYKNAATPGTNQWRKNEAYLKSAIQW